VADSPCDTCSACCLSAVVPPFAPEEIETLPEDLAAPILSVWAHAADPEAYFWDQTGRRACSWLDLDTGKCRYYTLRPKECRDFEVGGADCNAHRRKTGINDTIPLTISAKGLSND